MEPHYLFSSTTESHERKPTFSANGAVLSCKVLQTYKVKCFLFVKVLLLVHSTRCKLMKLQFTISLIVALRSWW